MKSKPQSIIMRAGVRRRRWVRGGGEVEGWGMVKRVVREVEAERMGLMTGGEGRL